MKFLEIKTVTGNLFTLKIDNIIATVDETVKGHQPNTLIYLFGGLKVYTHSTYEEIRSILDKTGTIGSLVGNNDDKQADKSL